jgi:hypothetical protein
LEQRVVGDRQGKQDREMQRDVGAITSSGRAVPRAIVVGREGAGGLVGGLKGRGGCVRGEGWAEAITLGTPSRQSLLPEGWHRGMKVRKVTIREEDRDRVVREVGI